MEDVLFSNDIININASSRKGTQTWEHKKYVPMSFFDFSLTYYCYE